MSQKNIIRLVAGVIALVGCVYFSVYVENLTEHREKLAGQSFSTEQMLDKFWNEDLDRLFEEALDLETFQSMLSENPLELIEKFGKTLGIGAPYSFIVKGRAPVGEATDESVSLFTLSSRFRYKILTNHIFSNTVREASGSFPIDDFENTMDFNTVSADINRRIVSQIVGPVKNQLQDGTLISFYGAVDVHPRKLSQTDFDIVPLKIEILSHE